MREPDKKQEFIRCYDLYAEAIFRHASFRVGRREDAKDITQDVFLKYWKYFSETRDEVKNPRALLYHIANNLIIDQWRKKKNESLDAMMDSGVEVEDPSADKFEVDLDAKDALKILGSLDDQEKDVMVMRYVDDLSVKNIADLLGLSPNVISVRIHRALKKLKSKFGLK